MCGGGAAAAAAVWASFFFYLAAVRAGEHTHTRTHITSGTTNTHIRGKGKLKGSSSLYWPLPPSRSLQDEKKLISEPSKPNFRSWKFLTKKSPRSIYFVFFLMSFSLCVCVSFVRVIFQIAASFVDLKAPIAPFIYTTSRKRREEKNASSFSTTCLCVLCFHSLKCLE